MIPPITHQGKPLGIAANEAPAHSERAGLVLALAGRPEAPAPIAPAALPESSRGICGRRSLSPCDRLDQLNLSTKAL
jgi:hypothetical protein